MQNEIEDAKQDNDDISEDVMQLSDDSEDANDDSESTNVDTESAESDESEFEAEAEFIQAAEVSAELLVKIGSTHKITNSMCCSYIATECGKSVCSCSKAAIYCIVCKRHPGHLTNDHRSQIQELLAILSPLCNLTDKLQSDGLTAPIVIPEIVAAFDELKLIKELKHFKTLHSHLVSDFKSRVEPIISNSAFVMATVLDPRQKLKGDRPTKDTDLKVLSPTDVHSMCHLFLENVAPLAAKNNTVTAEEADRKNLSLLQRMLMEVKNTDDEEPYDEGISELKSYLQDAIDPGTDPLTYWNKRQVEYPNLSRHAKVCLATPATSGSVERLFSELSGLGRARRSRTRAKRLEQLILYIEWRPKLSKRSKAKEKTCAEKI
ncbi:unnamed protein product [Allacma fusca]|uniref:HAT C-terminal dimerisation domain-containing protein n=1 Tax=Allacma fusca TaxID=39272 RepID=A0A8J2JFG0_9HEXA|nr:unnamed protein product [Allacma fusca]